MPGLARGRGSLVGWTLSSACSLGTGMGRSSGIPAIHSAPGAGAGDVGAYCHRCHSLGRLAASALCADTLRNYCRSGRARASALHHETDCQSTDLGFDTWPHRAWIRNSVLGSVSRPATIGGGLCLSLTSFQGTIILVCVVLYQSPACGSNETFHSAGTSSSGMGRAAKSRWQGLASHRAQRADLETRALSVAIPVSAYICR